MYIVWHWNWGWYRTVFDDLEDARYYYTQRFEIARMKIEPEPYVTNKDGNKIEI